MKRELYINPNWTYKETISQIKTLKCDFKGILASFSYFDIHYKTEYICSVKKRIYSLNFEEWRRNKIWEYLNDDEDLETLQKLV